jgi:hypothetical protein
MGGATRPTFPDVTGFEGRVAPSGVSDPTWLR